MSVLNENQLLGSSGAGGDYEIEQSLRFDDGRDTYLSRTPSVAGNRKTWTWSGWVKLGSMPANNVFLFSSGAFGLNIFNFNTYHLTTFSNKICFLTLYTLLRHKFCQN